MPASVWSIAAKDISRGGKYSLPPPPLPSPAVSRSGLVGQGNMTDERKQRLQNVSDTIKELLDGYDIRLRPQFGGDAAY